MWWLFISQSTESLSLYLTAFVSVLRNICFPPHLVCHNILCLLGYSLGTDHLPPYHLPLPDNQNILFLLTSVLKVSTSLVSVLFYSITTWLPHHSNHHWINSRESNQREQREMTAVFDALRTVVFIFLIMFPQLQKMQSLV